MEDSEQREKQVIEKGGIKIPKLDLTSIYIQREVVSSQNDNDDSNSDEENESYYNEQAEDTPTNGDS
jgi:hypothetical protein